MVEVQTSGPVDGPHLMSSGLLEESHPDVEPIRFNHLDNAAERAACHVFTADHIIYDIEIDAAHAVVSLPIKAVRIDDEYANWHRNTKPLPDLIKCHLVRLVKGWESEQAVVTFLEEHPNLAVLMRLEEVPDQSTLWRAWNDRFTDELRDSCRRAAQRIVEVARENGIPTPDTVFQPEEKQDVEERSERRLITDKTKEVWQQAKPFLTDSFHLKRGQNAQIPEAAFWEQHTFMGMRADMYAESGVDSFAGDTTRERTPKGSNHRWQIRKLDPDEIRAMVRKTTRKLIEQARRNSELVGKLWAAIDITKGYPWLGDIERDGEGDITEDYLLGYKDGNLYHQWASIQIVGHDIPLVLDVLPVERGMAREEIVHELLGNALDLVDDLELVMMDREFDGDGVKDVCEDHSVYYLNPAKKHSSERAKCTRLRREGKPITVEEQPSVEGPSRKRMYLPATADDAEPDIEELDETEGENLRQELVSEFGDAGGDADDLEGKSTPFGDLLDDIRTEEDVEEPAGNDEDARTYALFETNHPAVSARDADDDRHSETVLTHMVGRLVRRYKHRWGIENGFKRIKKFMVRTTSKDHEYRFFNFVFACVLYNVWRLVDLLVKLSLEDEPGYKPRVDANQFLTYAKKYYGLDPPD